MTCQGTETDHPIRSSISRNYPLRDGVLAGTILFFTASLSITLLYQRANEVCSDMLRAGLLRRAQAAASLVDGDLHRTFTSSEQEAGEDYRRAVAPLCRVLQGVEGLRFVYTVILEDDQVYFVLDATPPGDADGDGVEDHSGIMELYEDATPAMLAALREGRATSDQELYEDEWGRLISGYAPFYDSAGQQVGVVGVDITVEEYQERLASIRRAALWGVVPALLVSTISGYGAYWLRRRTLHAEVARQHSRDALQASEEYHRQIFESVTDAMLLFDLEGRIVEANPAACRMYGRAYEVLIGLYGKDIVHPDCRHLFERFKLELVATGKFHAESVDVRGDGTTFDVEVHGASVHCQGRRQLLAVVRDVTARKRAQRDLEKATAAAEAANRSKSEFLANMSHEIRTPMTAILGFADVLLERGDLDEAPPERVEAVQTIKRNGEYLIGIINDILDLSKIEAGKLTVERIRCSPCQLIAEVASLMRVRADAKGLPIRFEYVGAIPETIHADPTRLRQVLINLIANAIKFTEAGEVRLVTRLVEGPRGQGAKGLRDVGEPPSAPIEPSDLRIPGLCLQFDIVDTGLGMTEDQAARLFQPFTQADTSTTRRFGGTGLGLVISKRLAELLGGDVAVAETHKGVGTRMRMTIATGPLDGVKMIEDPLAATVLAADGTSTETSANRPALQGCRILLAEDGPDNQRLIVHLLKKAGAEVTVVENGKLAADEALAARDETNPFDVILMDMQMPVMDGYGATSLLRQKGYASPIIALTAHAMASDRQKCLDSGCDDYVSKPIERKKLIETIRRCMNSAVRAGTSA